MQSKMMVFETEQADELHPTAQTDPSVQSCRLLGSSTKYFASHRRVLQLLTRSYRLLSRPSSIGLFQLSTFVLLEDLFLVLVDFKHGSEDFDSAIDLKLRDSHGIKIKDHEQYMIISMWRMVDWRKILKGLSENMGS